MDDAVFSVIIYVILSMGLLSVAWLRTGMKGITDNLLKELFRYLSALTMVTIAFTIGILFIEIMSSSGLVYRTVISISLVAIFALISGAARSVKKIGDVYGFNVPDAKGQKK
jgi:uncharacterized membrane protein